MLISATAAGGNVLACVVATFHGPAGTTASSASGPVPAPGGPAGPPGRPIRNQTALASVP